MKMIEEDFQVRLGLIFEWDDDEVKSRCAEKIDRDRRGGEEGSIWWEMSRGLWGRADVSLW
jgi:hypothetical protein